MEPAQFILCRFFYWLNGFYSLNEFKRIGKLD